MRKALFGLVLLLLVVPVYSQSPLITWTTWECVCSDCAAVCPEEFLVFRNGFCDTCFLECPIGSEELCFENECRGSLPTACGVSTEMFGSGCFPTSAFEREQKNVNCTPVGSLCVNTAETPNLVDSFDNNLIWGYPFEGGGSSKARSSGVAKDIVSNVFEGIEFARVELTNDVIIGGTGVGYGDIRINSDLMDNFVLTDCDDPPGESIVVQGFFYNTVNYADQTPFQNRDFLCFPDFSTLLPDNVKLPEACSNDPDLCPRCIGVSEPDPDPGIGGAFILGSIVPISPFARQAHQVIVPTHVGDPFGDADVTPFRHVSIDVLPGECPNFLQLRRNLSSSPMTRSMVEVTAYGTEAVDVSDLDPERIAARLPGDGSPVEPVDFEFVDVGAPIVKSDVCDCGSGAPDGHIDMIVRFPAAEFLQRWENTEQSDAEFSVAFRFDSDGGPAESSDCLTLGTCPEADVIAPDVEITAPQTGRIALPSSAFQHARGRGVHGLIFRSDDDDGFDGGVVSERVLLDDCLLLDGEMFGDRDGLLSDDEVMIDDRLLCRAVESCNMRVFRNPSLIVEAQDCAGNIGSDQLQFHGVVRVNEQHCRARLRSEKSGVPYERDPSKHQAMYGE